MAHGSTQRKQNQRLDEINTLLLPKFQYRDQLKRQLPSIEDPVLKDAVEHQLVSLRNEILEAVINDIPDFLDSISNRWNNGLREGEGTSHKGKDTKVLKFRNGEVKSYVYENLLEAVNRYNPSVKPFCKFTTFFWMYNQNILRNRLKRMRADKRDCTKTDSLDVIMNPNWDGNEEEGKSCYDKLIISESHMEERISSHMVLKDLYKKASLKQKHVLKRLYLGYKQNEIATALGVSGTNINMTIKQMRREFAGMFDE